MNYIRMILILVILVLLSCFGGKSLPENPPPILFSALKVSDQTPGSNYLLNEEDILNSIFNYLKNSGQVRPTLISNLKDIFSPADTSVFQTDPSALLLVQIKFLSNGFETDKTSLVPYLIHKPKIKHSWRFFVTIWPKNSKNFVYSGEVTGEVVVKSHIDVIDFDATDPSLGLTAIQKEEAKQKSLQKFNENLLVLIKRYVPKL